MKKAVIFCCILALGVAYYFRGKWWSSQPDLTVVGFIKLADGLGRQSPELMDNFKDEFKINFRNTRNNCFSGVSKAVRAITKSPNKKAGKVILFEEMLWYPNYNPSNRVPKSEDSVTIAYSMFESTKIPQEWVDILNEKFHAVVVPDPFLVPVYKESGVRVPVFVIPLAINIKPFLEAPLKKEKKTPFVFANLSAGSDRKNLVTLVKAFIKEFGNNSDVELRINCRMGEGKVFGEISKEMDEYKNIKFTQLSLCQEKYFALFQNVDCYVSLSKGEGFSIQPREAMALGIPVIATDNSGQGTICRSDLVRVVPSLIPEPASYPWGTYYGKCFGCTTEDAAQALRDVYENYESYLAKSSEARAWASQYTYEHLKPLYRTLIKPSKVVLGDEDKITADCLMTTSQALYDRYTRIVCK